MNTTLKMELAKMVDENARAYMPVGEYMVLRRQKRVMLDAIETVLATPVLDTGEGIAYLHYFKGGCDWYLVTRPENLDAPMLAHGLAILGHMKDCAEMGDISITELVSAGVELDLYFSPTPLSKIREQHGI